MVSKSRTSSDIGKAGNGLADSWVSLGEAVGEGISPRFGVAELRMLWSSTPDLRIGLLAIAGVVWRVAKVQCAMCVLGYWSTQCDALLIAK